MMDVTTKLDMLAVGTRYEFYRELRDAFDEGILILENALRVEPNNKTSQERLNNLKICVGLIDARIGYLTDLDKGIASYGDLARVVRNIPPNRPAQLPECSESTRKACEEEMRKARETGYAEDGGQEGSANNQGQTPKKP
jgi:hypothetical protein